MDLTNWTLIKNAMIERDLYTPALLDLSPGDIPRVSTVREIVATVRSGLSQFLVPDSPYHIVDVNAANPTGTVRRNPLTERYLCQQGILLSRWPEAGGNIAGEFAGVAEQIQAALRWMYVKPLMSDGTGSFGGGVLIPFSGCTGAWSNMDPHSYVNSSASGFSGTVFETDNSTSFTTLSGLQSYTASLTGAGHTNLPGTPYSHTTYFSVGNTDAQFCGSEYAPGNGWNEAPPIHSRTGTFFAINGLVHKHSSRATLLEQYRISNYYPRDNFPVDGVPSSYETPGLQVGDLGYYRWTCTATWYQHWGYGSYTPSATNFRKTQDYKVCGVSAYPLINGLSAPRTLGYGIVYTDDVAAAESCGPYINDYFSCAFSANIYVAVKFAWNFLTT
ncbi:MAG: hypothetical protein Q4D98_03595 [Planctomycetia bacterium]|nr:hypothetical protein [Planctomycetia bacterium]